VKSLEVAKKISDGSAIFMPP